ncbi:hypothetical protein Hanom_Chr06g00529751 [Helianthus anomalus]
MLRLDFSTSQTLSNVGCYMSFHARPPIRRLYVTCELPPLQVLAVCHRVEPKCVRLRSRHRLPLALTVVSSCVKLLPCRFLVSTLLPERLVSGKEDWTGFYNICFARMVLDGTFIIIQQLNPSTLTHVQFFLVEDMLKAPMVGVDGAFGTVQIVPPDLQRKYHSS